MISVTVLMSTYNGEKYLREQLDSIFAQKNVSVELVVRDDASSDRTVDILKEYQKIHEKMIIINDRKNLGACNSFLYLIRTYTQGKYFALADQDDIWDADKLVIAVKAIETVEKKKSDIPLLYYSNLRVVNEKNEFGRMSHSTPHVSKNRYAALIENLATGCTVVYNRDLANLAKSAQPEQYSMHDVWLYRVAKIFGEAIYDFEPHINYRQHAENVVGTSIKKVSLRKIERELKWMLDTKQSEWYTDIEIFYNQFFARMNEDTQKACLKILNSKCGIKSKFDLIMDKRYRSNSSYRNIKFIIKVLLQNA